MLVVETFDVNEIRRLRYPVGTIVSDANGKPIISRSIQNVVIDNPKDNTDAADNRQIRVRFLNPHTGIAEQRRVSIHKLRYIKRYFGNDITSTGSLRYTASMTTNSLGIQYGRHALLAMLHHWPTTATTTTTTTIASTSKAKENEDANFSQTIQLFDLSLFDASELKSLSKPQQFINLIKMVAASEDGFSSLASEDGDMNNSDGSASLSTRSTTLIKNAMTILTSKLKTILTTESTTESITESITESTAEGTKSESESELELSLATVLVNECTDHVFKTTKIGDSDNCKVYESLHPYWAKGMNDGESYRGPQGVEYSEEVIFPGSKALRIRFDPSCCTESGASRGGERSRGHSSLSFTIGKYKKA